MPPGELYTSFEKMILPFDYDTWIVLIITFSLALLLVNIVNHCPHKIKNYLYGKSVQTPLLNIFRIFFGIGQTKLPDGHFGRIILVSFIFWCLVIRTIYQGILFILTTNAVTKPTLESLDELSKRNFTLFVPNVANPLLIDVLTEMLR